MDRDKALAALVWVVFVGVVPVGVALVGAVVISAVAVESVRLLVMVAFCLLVPGLGWARRAGQADLGDTLALAVLISMSATILVSTAMVVMNAWSVGGGVAALIAFGVLGFVPFRRGPAFSRTHP